jgi:hypothetical protein
MTLKQKIRFTVAETKIPEGYNYHLHSETYGKGRFSNLEVSGDVVWGISVFKGRESVGHVQKRGPVGLTTCPKNEIATVRLFLNRASAALWHRQPVWPQ